MPTAHQRSPAGAQLMWMARPAMARGVVLVLHGGPPHSAEKTSWLQASVLRAMPLAGAIAARGRGEVAVAFLKHAVRGWNEVGRPVRDALWAVQVIRAAYGDVSLGLVGHSMGGRTALHLAGQCHAHALVTLSAWVVPAEVHQWRPCPSLNALLVHGSADRVTSPNGTEIAAQSLRARGARVEIDIIEGDTHALLRYPWYTQRRTAHFIVPTLISARG